MSIFNQFQISQPRRRSAGKYQGLMFSLICAWITGWVKNREAGNLRRHCTHYEVTVMTMQTKWLPGEWFRCLPWSTELWSKSNFWASTDITCCLCTVVYNVSVFQFLRKFHKKINHIPCWIRMGDDIGVHYWGLAIRWSATGCIT